MEIKTKHIFTYNIKNYTVYRIINGSFRENCFLIKQNNTDELIIFDPGDNLEVIDSVISEIGGNLKGILLTHGHFDHVGLVAPLTKKYNLVAKVHKNETRLMRQAPMYSIRCLGKNIPLPTPFETFETEETIQLGNFIIDITATPGHTSGCVCFYIDGILITGDTLLHKHIGPTNYPESQPELFLKSIDKLLAKYSGDTIIFPGHGKEWNIKDACQWWQTARENCPEYQIMNDKEINIIK